MFGIKEIRKDINSLQTIVSDLCDSAREQEFAISELKKSECSNVDLEVKFKNLEQFVLTTLDQMQKNMLALSEQVHSFCPDKEDCPHYEKGEGA